jgi:ferritin-like metal-binding protein YciE
MECPTSVSFYQELTRNLLLSASSQSREQDAIIGADLRHIKHHEISLYENVCEGLGIIGKRHAAAPLLCSLSEERAFMRKLSSTIPMAMLAHA